MKKIEGTLLAAATAILLLANGPGLYSQTAENKDVKKDKKKTEEGSKEAGSAEKRKLKGSFKGQPIETPQGQSLSDVVDAARAAREKKQQAREERKPKPPVISNTDLKPKTPAAANGKPQPTEAPAPASADAQPTATPYRPTDLEGHDESYWREKSKAARERVDRAREAVAAADEEAKKQENDFYAWDDGQYRDNIIKPAWDRAKEALESAQKELSDAEEALNNLDDEARKAGALPGWIR